MKFKNVVLIVKFIFILKMVCFFIFWDTIFKNVETRYIVVFGRNILQCSQWVGKVCDIKCRVKIYTKCIIHFYQCDFPSTCQFLIIFGMGFELLTAVSICNVVVLGHHMVW